jgi:cysteine-rich repeat protein
VYALTLCSRVFKSLDGGDSWSAINSGLTDWYVTALAIAPTTPATLYVGSSSACGPGCEGNQGGVFRSLNGGSSWSAVNAGLTDTNVNALAIDPTTPTTLYAGTYSGGVFRSLNGGSSWSAVNAGLTSTSVLALAIDPATPTTLYAGTYDGVFKSLNAGSSWSVVNTGLTSTSVLALAIDPATPTTLYAGTGGGVFKSLNAGSSWSAVNTGLPSTSVLVLAIDPVTPATLYAGTYDAGVFQSLNGGGSWSAVNTGLPNEPVRALAIAPTTPTTLYAGPNAAGNTFSGDGVFRSLNGGSSWQATGRLGCGDASLCWYEQCDDGNTVNGDGCDANCTPTACGNGIVTTGEQCEDGNRNPFDGCTNECTVCGDGVVTPPEECDGDNTPSGAGCDAQCRRPHVVGTGTSESCTETAFEAALSERSVSFNCGPAPVTITVTSEKAITADTAIDGGGRVTLSGGGAVRILTVDASAAVDVRNLTLADGSGNYGGLGGGIYNSGTLTLTNCTLSNNSAETGGGIFNSGVLTLTNCTLNGNSARGGSGGFGDGSGGGIYNSGGYSNEVGRLTLTNCTLSGNSAVGEGGGIANGVGVVTLTNSTLSENGGAISNLCAPRPCDYCSYCQSGPVTLTNTIIAESAGPSCGETDPITDGGHNLQYPGTSCGATIQSLDPLLDPAGLTDNGGPTQTIALLPNSPAINAGDADVCANPPVNGIDQRGFARPASGHTQCSIGAYEADAVSPEPCVGDCDGTGSVTIAEIITLVNIALGTTQPSACPHGVPSGADVDVALVIQAVSVALTGCG